MNPTAPAVKERNVCVMAFSKKTAEAAQPAEKPAAKTARKSPVRKAPAAKKTAAKTPVAKQEAGEMKEMKVSLFVQYLGKEVSQADMVAAVKNQWQGEEIQSLDLYVKPEDKAVYYVVNGVPSASGKVEL